MDIKRIYEAETYIKSDGKKRDYKTTLIKVKGKIRKVDEKSNAKEHFSRTNTLRFVNNKNKYTRLSENVRVNFSGSQNIAKKMTKGEEKLKYIYETTST